jgi:Zinc finger, C3HC4 type (RING finger)
MYGGATKASFYKLSNDVSLYKQVMEGVKGTVTRDDLKKIGLKIFEETDCIICLDAKPDMVYDICGHMCICKKCHGVNKNSNKCPMCNTNNKNAYPVTDAVVDGDDDE